MVMVIYSALVRSHQSTSADSFGLVRPAWIEYTRSAVPQNVESVVAVVTLAWPWPRLAAPSARDRVHVLYTAI